VPVHQVDPSNRRELKRFVALERDFYAGQPLAWTEPLADVRKHLSGRSAHSEGLDLALWVAERDGEPIARCASVVHRHWQRDRDDTRGGIGWFAAAPGADGEVTEMLRLGEDWLRERDADAALAPFNGTGFLGMGLMTDGFDESPMFPMQWQPPYLEELLTGAGYRRRYPMWSYWVDFAGARYRRARDSALSRPGCVIREIDKSRWKDELELARTLFNDGMREEWEMHAYTPREFAETWSPLKAILDPRLMLFAECDGEPAGFVMGIGDLTPLFRTFRGRLGPLQVLRLLRHGKRFDRCGLFAIAVLDRFRGRGAGRSLAARLFANFEEMGQPGAFYYVVNDHNRRSRSLAQSFGGEGRVYYHVLEKSLI
jgi:hypothetical protein